MKFRTFSWFTDLFFIFTAAYFTPKRFWVISYARVWSYESQFAVQDVGMVGDHYYFSSFSFLIPDFIQMRIPEATR